MRRVAVASLLVLSACAAAFAQDVQTDPLQCWWKTSAGVRSVISEAIAYGYARLLFRPRAE